MRGIDPDPSTGASCSIIIGGQLNLQHDDGKLARAVQHEDSYARAAVQLAAFEAASFAPGYARPELDVHQAHALLERWLG